MKLLQYLIIFLLSFSSLTVAAQYDGEGVDEISRFRPGSLWFYSGLIPFKEGKLRKYDRLMVDLTYNDWMGDLKPFNNQWGSIGVNTSFMWDIPMTEKNTASFGIGLSHSFFRISNKYHSFTPDASNTFTVHQEGGSTPELKHRYLGGNSLSVPIEFRFRTKGWKHFKVHIGGKVGYQLDAFAKNVYKDEFGKSVEKYRNFSDVSRLIYSAHLRIGIRNWALFGSYNFNKIFKNDQSPNIHLLQMGLTLSLF
ncbi:MAG: hypothetical protein V4638_10150 [Bacteroidota bacterium]